MQEEDKIYQTAKIIARWIIYPIVIILGALSLYVGVSLFF
jgi:hypothetical protein